jgi:hypothetical protein
LEAGVAGEGNGVASSIQNATLPSSLTGGSEQATAGKVKLAALIHNPKSKI